MASRLFAVDLDLGLNKAKQFVFEDFSSDPTAATGRVYFNTSGTPRLKVYTGAAWKSVAYTDDVVAGTTYDLAAGGTTSPTITLTGSDSSTDTVTFAAGTGISLGQATGTITITNTVTDTNTTYTFASGTTNGAFSVTPSGSSAQSVSIYGWNGSNWDTAYGWGDHSAAGYLTSETDPVFTASDAYGITSTDISNWDTAFGWGNHASAGYLTSETDPVFTASDAFGITSTDISNWDAAYGWGNHASAGYLTTETDPVFVASDVYGVTSTDISNWDTAYGWGNHASAGYLTTAVESISNTDGNITFSASTGSVTADLATDVEIGGDLTVGGDLNVTGAINSVSTTVINVEDNTFLLNSTVTGSPIADAGLQVERGTETNASLLWDESAGFWSAGLLGAEKQVARKYATSVNTTGGSASTITHNLGTQDVIVQTFVSGQQVEADVNITGNNTVTVTTNASTTGVKVVVIG